MSHLDTHIQPRSAYLHIPFCHRRCFYCDFAIVPLGDKASGVHGPGSKSIKDYLKLLHREITLSPKGPPLSTVYIGGGTPSLLSPSQIGSLLHHLRRHFGLQQGAELTLEIDPASFSQEDLNGYLEEGINRVSLGVQSFEDVVLGQIGRRHNKSDILNACQMLSSAYRFGEIHSWSIDLIQNLPGQTVEDWDRQLSQAIEISVPHLSIYDLTVEPGTVFQWRQSRGELNLPGEDEAFQIMRLTSSKLCKAGFSRYEISNYALPGHTSRHNRVYWNGSGWWGFGQGATSAPWGERLARPRTRKAYRNWVEKQYKGLHSTDPSLLEEKATPMSLDERLIVGLRCREGIDLDFIASKYGWSINKYKVNIDSLQINLGKYLESSLLKFSGRRLQLTDPEGMEVSNQVLAQILLWVESLSPDSVLLSSS